jgi:tetratricopeptide (TPR) repeat protein
MAETDDGAMLAISNVTYDEIDTPEALARESKDKGNASFTKGASFYANAIKHYNDAIKHAGKGTAAKYKEEMTTLTSVCWSNLAAIYLARGKFITVLDCAQQALRVWPGNVKAAFRAAKACVALGRANVAIELCELGLKAEPSNSALQTQAKEARELLERQERIRRKTEEETAVRNASLDRVRAAVKERGLRIGPPLFSGMKRTLTDPYVDESDCLHWPVLVLYPQYGQSDYVEDVPEVASLGEVLAMVLQDEGPSQPWDERREYFASNCDLFFKTNACKPLASIERAWTPASVEDKFEDTFKANRWVRVPPAAPLLLALIHESYVIADIPVFYCVARSSSFYAEMKRAAGGSFLELKVPELPQQPDEE